MNTTKFWTITLIVGIILSTPLVHSLIIEREWNMLSNELRNRYGREYSKIRLSENPEFELLQRGLTETKKGQYRYSKKTFCYLSVIDYQLNIVVIKFTDYFELSWESTFKFDWKLF